LPAPVPSRERPIGSSGVARSLHGYVSTEALIAGSVLVRVGSAAVVLCGLLTGDGRSVCLVYLANEELRSRE
jgi:hypothetical protein